MGCSSSAEAKTTRIPSAEDIPTLLLSPKSKNPRKDSWDGFNAGTQCEAPKKEIQNSANVSAKEPSAESIILKMIIGGCDDEKSILSSNTDAELESKASFAEKDMTMLGNITDPSKSGLGFTCRKGVKSKSRPNQDSWLILKTGELSIYGVFDGHGHDGHSVSNYVKEVLPQLIVKTRAFIYESCRRTGHNMEKMLKDSFKKLQNMIAEATQMSKINAEFSGCTTTIIIHDHVKSKLYVSWVGDSGACVGKKTASGIVPLGLTWDHKPEIKEERMRIEKRGGQVLQDDNKTHRVWDKDHMFPGLNMSRAMGDLMGEIDAGISTEPSLKVYDIAPEDEVLLICSDGIWTYLSFDEAVNIVSEFPSSQAGDAAEKLATEARNRWRESSSSVDDITALVIYLNPGADTIEQKTTRESI